MREMLDFDSSLWTLVNFLFSLTRSYHTMLFIADEKKVLYQGFFVGKM